MSDHDTRYFGGQVLWLCDKIDDKNSLTPQEKEEFITKFLQNLKTISQGEFKSPGAEYSMAELLRWESPESLIPLVEKAIAGYISYMRRDKNN